MMIRTKKISLHILITVAVLGIFMLILSAHTFAASGIDGSAKVNAQDGIYLRKSASVKSRALAVLPDNTVLKVYREEYRSKKSTSAKKVWYYVKANGMKGYVRSDLVDSIKYPEYSATLKRPAYLRKGPGVRMKSLGHLRKGTNVTVYINARPVKSTMGSSRKWYRVSVDGEYGYICSKNIRLGSLKSKTVKTSSTASENKTSSSKNTSHASNAFSKMSSAEFESYLTKQGFPESYKPGLRALHKAHPNWAFTAYHTGISWNEAMKKETKFGVSLVHKSYPKSYRSTSKNSYSSYKMAAADLDEAPVEGTKATVKADKATLFTEAKQDSEAVSELVKGSEVTIKSEAGEESDQKWYQVEAVVEQSLTDDKSLAYDSSDDSEDSELEAENKKAEEEIIGSDKDDSDEAAGDDESADQDDTVPVTLTGYIRAEDIELVSDPAKTEAAEAEEQAAAESAEDENVEMTPQEVLLGPAGEENSDEMTIAQDLMTASDEETLTEAAQNTESNCSNDEELELVQSGEASDAYYMVESGWYNASANVVAYFMDPRNFLNEDRIFMFEDLSFKSEYQTDGVVSKIISASKLISNGFTTKIFMNAGKQFKISPVFLAARVLQETGGNSASVNGSKSGGTVVYNPFNIGAYGKNAVSKGLAYAKKMGWTTPAKSVNGAAQYLASGYISKKQNSIYFQRFNVANGISKVGTHQYMTNIMAPYSEAYITKSSYSKMGITGEALAFVIPVYKGMPDKTKLP